MTQDEDIKYIKENIEPALEELKKELSKIEYTPEMERAARELGRIGFEDWFRPFTI